MGRALWGVYAVDLGSGEVLADINGMRLFVPASNRKLVATALAASVYEPGDRLATDLVSPPLSSTGVAEGDVVLVASGDPSWTTVLQGGRSGVAMLQRLAADARSAGLTRIAGDLVIATGRFADPQPLGPGWIWDDLDKSYGARPSVLAVNHNLLGLQLAPSAIGQPVEARWAIPIEGPEILNLSETAPAGAAPTLRLSRGLSGERVILEGRLPAGSANSARGVPLGDPVERWGELLRYYLEEEGVRTDGRVRLVARPERPERLLATVLGASVGEMMTECNEESDNFLAEALYLLASAKQYGRGSYEGAYQLEERFWEQLGVEAGEVKPADGSGLSRENFITPHAMTRLLVEFRDLDWWVDTLPVSGRTGTLRYRLSEGLAGRVRAKTGTLTGISALSGYVTTNGGRVIAFSIFANHYTASTAAGRRAIDEMVEILAGG